jgi:dTDP-4-amino-4,6-dideoxygalactose transaminase
MAIGLVDLQRQRAALEPGLSQAMQRVLEHGGFVNGPEVAKLEAELAAFVGGGQVICCANGTDALQLLLRGAGIGAGHCVFVPSLTFAATAEAVALTGAVPVFVDVDPGTGTLAPQSLRDALEMMRARGDIAPRAVIAVDLFSIPADTAAIAAMCRAEGLWHFVDAAHSIGTDTAEGRCGSLADASATSFYPSKALGCYGDGGAVFTADAGLAERARSIANHGVAAGSATHQRLGTNSRLDTLQAAVLLEKLKVFDAELAARRAVAARYFAALGDVCALPVPPAGANPAWSYFAIRHPARDRLQQHLEARGIRTVAYYREPTHTHPAFAEAPVAPGGLPGTMAFAQSLLCLPMHPYLTQDEVGQVIAAVLEFGGA